MSNKKPTMQTIADALGISKVTVHKALNDQTGVSYNLAIAIKKKAKETGYFFTGSRHLRHHAFLYIARKTYFENESELFYTAIYKNLNELCRKNGAKLFLSFCDNIKDLETITSRVYKSNRISGAFIAGEFSPEILSSIEKLPLSKIAIDFYSPIYKFNYVNLLSYYDSFRLTMYAIKNGHTKLGYIGPVGNKASLTDRYLGFRKALMDNHIQNRHEWCLIADTDNMDNLDSILPKELPTVFLCHCDLTSAKLINALKNRNLKVPDDVSVLSFDNTDLAINFTPKITSMGASKEEIAEESLSLMQNVLENPDNKKNVVINPAIYERESFKKLN